jgi:hypothetical protein
VEAEVQPELRRDRGYLPPLVIAAVGVVEGDRLPRQRTGVTLGAQRAALGERARRVA